MNIYLIIILLLLYIVLFKINNYDIIEYNNFLTNDECDKLISLVKDNLIVSKIYRKDNDIVSPTFRNSYQSWLNEDSDIIVKNIINKIRKITNSSFNYIEPIQIVKYPENGFFNLHYDACKDTDEICERMNLGRGPRYKTFIIYLNDNFNGGETNFPKKKKIIKPNKRKGVLFYNTDKNGNILDESLHAGLPITKGNKWIANVWIHLY